jgi:translation initiation factor 3 subunit C
MHGMQDRLFATLANKELTKKMSPTNAKALNTMRQRLRKHNPFFAEQMEKFRAAPESEEEESEDEESSSSSSSDSDDEVHSLSQLAKLLLRGPDMSQL